MCTARSISFASRFERGKPGGGIEAGGRVGDAMDEGSVGDGEDRGIVGDGMGVVSETIDIFFVSSWGAVLSRAVWEEAGTDRRAGSVVVERRGRRAVPFCCCCCCS